ncbi:MAG: M48 family peptidase [Candidatus Ryanbacteria bacterium]|nr:M48 family peptidase [Candidatus Ryanbacteria bacterium]
MRISVHRDGSVRATQPARLATRHFLAFLESNIAWVAERLRYVGTLPPVIRPTRHSKAEKIRLSLEAKALAVQRLRYFNQSYGFAYNKIAIRDQKTKWGSCSIKGNLNFNYRIALLPAELADYIIVHELCHLRELNHSKRFWALVAKTLPNHKELRKAVKKNTH